MLKVYQVQFDDSWINVTPISSTIPGGGQRVISINLDWKRLAVIIAALLYIGGAIAVFLISDQFPLMLRLLHGMEMFADASFAGIVIAYLLGRH